MAYLSLFYKRPNIFFQAWEGSRRPRQAAGFLQTWFPPSLQSCSQKYYPKWLKTDQVQPGFSGPPMEKKVLLALPVTWCKENKVTFLFRETLAFYWHKKKEPWLLSQSQEDPEQVTVLMFLEPLFSEMCLEMLTVALGKTKGSPTSPCPAVACVCAEADGFWWPCAKTRLSGRKISFPQHQTKGDFFFPKQNLQAITHHIQGITGAVKSKESV